MLCARNERADHPLVFLLLHIVHISIIIVVVVFVVEVCVGQMESKEFFSSVSKLKTLPAVESQLLGKFEEVLQALPGNDAVVDLKKKIEHLKRVSSKHARNATLMENPFHAFRLIKRMVKQWASVFRASTKIVASSGGQLKGWVPEFLNSTQEWLGRQGVDWPTAVDLSGAATALVRLHHVYGLHYDALSRGRFLNVTSAPPMTSLELSYVTRAAVDLGYVCDAERLLEALERARNREEKEEVEGEKQGGERRGGGRGGGASRVKTLRKKLADLKKTGTASGCDRDRNFSVSAVDSEAGGSLQEKKDMFQAMYHQLCRKSVDRAVVYGSGTRCYYWHAPHIPYLRFKADVVNSDPFIVAFHDVINDDEIREMKELAFGKISPSSLAVDEVKHETQLVRISQNTWLFDTSPTLTRLSQRVHHVTGLSTRVQRQDTHAEPYQVLNYGLGGMHGLHEDSVRVPRHQGKENTPPLKDAGDRTATWMFYLSDVPLGGATVFPLQGAAVRPQKGVAVWWYNLKRSGQADVRTVHAACPVLYGDKWVANKWLREAGNTFTRPCLLDPDL